MAQSIQASTPSKIGEPDSDAFQPMPLNLSSPLVAKARHTSSWSAPRTLTQKLPEPAMRDHDPDVLVDVDRHGGRVHVVTGISVDGGRPAADTLRAVGERVRDLLDSGTTTTADLVSVTVHLVEDPVPPDHAAAAAAEDPRPTDASQPDR